MSSTTVLDTDPEVLGGTPVFVGTRVPLRNLLDYLEGGDSLDDFLRSFPSVSREQAVAALELLTGTGDPVVAGVRLAREALFAAAGYDLEALCQKLRQEEADSGREVVTLRPRRPGAEGEAEWGRKKGPDGFPLSRE